MTTRPNPTDATDSGSDAPNPFTGLGVGMNFFQDWMKAAGAAMPGMGVPGAPAATGMPAWSMPTLDPEALEKRIQELKTVQFWLEQNGRMIGMTIQGLEVQKMTLSTLQGMNVSMDVLKDALTANIQPASTTSSDNANGEQATSSDADGELPSAADLVNPMQWWGALTQQFSQLAGHAAQSAQDASAQADGAEPGQERKARKASTSSSTTKPTPARKPASPRKTTASKTTRKTSAKT